LVPSILIGRMRGLADLGRFHRLVDQGEIEDVGGDQSLVGRLGAGTDDAGRARSNRGVVAPMDRLQGDRVAFELKGRRREAACLDEEHHRHAVAVPVGKTGDGLVAQAERNALHVDRAFVLDADGMIKLVDQDRVRVGGEGFFIALKGLAFGNTVTDELAAETECDLVALALLGFGFQLDDAVRGSPDQRRNGSSL
jgi:hypothetical protein